MTQGRRPAPRRRAGLRALGASGAVAVASLLVVTLVGKPVARAGVLPSLPIWLPSLPLPPLPTILPPLPTVPLPTLPVPTLPVPSLPVPSLPVPTLPLSSGGPAAGSPSPSSSGDPSTSPAPLGPGLASAGPSASGGAPGSVTDPTVDQGSAPFGFVLPLLIAGIPIAVILLIVGLQIVGGAAWLPVIRRWLNRTPTAGP
jgi:hypothetical protein